MPQQAGFHEYAISDTLECGIVLKGTEVKSLREGVANLEDAYAKIEADELWLIGSDIPEYTMGNKLNHKPKRQRKLLVHKREFAKFAGKAAQTGLYVGAVADVFQKRPGQGRAGRRPRQAAARQTAGPEDSRGPTRYSPGHGGAAAEMKLMVKGFAMSPQARFANLIFSRKAAALAGGFTALIFLGCMCFNIGSQFTIPETFEQEGQVTVPANCEMDVFYPIPYATPPNLTFENGHNDCFLVEQKNNHFRIFNKNVTKARTIDWKANGQRVPPPVEEHANMPALPPSGGDSGPAGAKIGQPKSNN